MQTTDGWTAITRSALPTITTPSGFISEHYACSTTYAFILEGDFTIGNQELNRRDGFGIWDTETFKITSLSENSEILLMEVPMI